MQRAVGMIVKKKTKYVGVAKVNCNIKQGLSPLRGLYRLYYTREIKDLML